MAIAQTVKALQGAGFLLGDPAMRTSEIKKHVGVAFTRWPALVNLPASTEALLFVVISSMLDSTWVSLDLMHKVNGIFMWGCQLRRVCMSLGKHIHTWLRRYEFERGGPSWETVRWELWEMRAFLPALRCDLHAGALPWVAAQDAQGGTANDFGSYGMGLACPVTQEIAGLAFRPPAKGLSVDVGGLIEGAPGVPGDPKFLPRTCVPLSWDRLRWHEVEAQDHLFKQHVTIYEGRATARWLYLCLRIKQTERSRLYTLSDNMPSAGAFTKGRSPSWCLNSLCRRRLGLEVASGVSQVIGWEPTFRMPLDTLSRERQVRRTMLNA